MIDVVRDAAVEVRKPTMFGELIIMIVYLPILTLEGIEGKLFRPMALTVIFALVGSMVLSLTLMPVLASLLLPRRIEEREPLLMRIAHRIYAPVLRFAMQHKTLVIGFAACVMFVAFGMIAPNLGSEFVPRLSEGAIAISVVRLAGTDLDDSIKYNTQMEKAVLAEFPDEVEHVWSRIGTAEIATDPMGIELTDMFITLKPREQWKKAHTQAELTDADREASARHAGPAAGVPAADRDADERNGLRRPRRRGGQAVRRRSRRAGGQRQGDRSHPEADSRQRRREQPSRSPASRCCKSSSNQEQLARLRRAGQGGHRHRRIDRQQAAGRSDRRAAAVSAGRAACPKQCATASTAIGSILVPTAAGERLPLSRLADIRVVEGPVDDHARMGPAADHGVGQRPRPRHRQLRRRGPAANEGATQAAAGPLLRRVRRAVRASAAGANAAADRRAAGAGADLRAAVRDVSKRGRRAARVHRRAVRLGRRHLRALAARHAVFDLGGDRLHRPVGRGRARRHDPGVATSGNCGAKGMPLDEAVDAGRHHAAAARADDHARGQPRLSADGVQHRHGRRSAAAAGHGRDRRRDRRDGHVAAWCCACCTCCSNRRSSQRRAVAELEDRQSSLQSLAQFNSFERSSR